MDAPLLQASRCTCGAFSLPPVDRCPECNRVPAKVEVQGKGTVEGEGVVAPAGPPGSSRTIVRIRLDSGVTIFAEVPDDRKIHRGERVIIDSFAEAGRYCVLPDK